MLEPINGKLCKNYLKHLKSFELIVMKLIKKVRRLMLESINGKLWRPLEIHRLQQKVMDGGIMCR